MCVCVCVSFLHVWGVLQKEISVQQRVVKLPKVVGLCLNAPWFALTVSPNHGARHVVVNYECLSVFSGAVFEGRMRSQ